MIEPKFTYTPKLINLIASIERTYGQLTQRSRIPSLALKITQENMILATHYSTSIEGNPLNQQEVTNVILDDTIPINKSEQEVKNYFKALNHVSVMAQKHVPLSIDLILELHKYCMAHVPIKHPGEFRDSSVIVGHSGPQGLVVKHNPPAHTKKEIEQYITDILDWVNSPVEHVPWVTAGILHHELAYIHPFFDGNGRVTRLATSYYLLLQGYEVTKYFVLDDYYDMDRLDYSDKLHSADSGDKTEWLLYFLEGILHSLISATARIDEISGHLVDEVTGEKRVLVTPREEEILQIVIEKKAIKMTDVQEQFDVTRQQVQALLSSLVRKGLLEKFGKTKASYYRLKGQEKLQITPS